MARGNWSRDSDYDVLVGLRRADEKWLIERIGEFEALVEGNIQVFPYDRPAWERMFESFYPLLLEALEHGMILFDRGASRRYAPPSTGGGRPDSSHPCRRVGRSGRPRWGPRDEGAANIWTPIRGICPRAADHQKPNP